MRAKDFITEAAPSEEQVAAGIVTILTKECTPFLQEINYDLYRYTLFRGVKQDAPDQLVMARPVDRQPMDTPYEDHDVADKFFFKNFGEKYRSNAFFVTGSLDQAQNYGDVYTAFPMGPFQICWSPIVNDLTNDLSMFQFNIYQGRTNLTPRQVAMKFLKQAKYGAGNIKKAIYSSNEIMVACNSLYMVKYRLSLIELVSKMLLGAKGAS